MKRLGLVLSGLTTAIALGGCSAQPSQITTGSIITPPAAEAQKKGGWTVACPEDAAAPRECAASWSDPKRPTAGARFTVFYVEGSGPYLRLAYHNEMRRKAVVRIDDGKVRATDEGRAVVGDMLAGKKLYGTWYRYPDLNAPQFEEVDLEGFAAAHAKLKAMIEVAPKPAQVRVSGS